MNRELTSPGPEPLNKSIAAVQTDMFRSAIAIHADGHVIDSSSGAEITVSEELREEIRNTLQEVELCRYPAGPPPPPNSYVCLAISQPIATVSTTEGESLVISSFGCDPVEIINTCPNQVGNLDQLIWKIGQALQAP